MTDAGFRWYHWHMPDNGGPRGFRNVSFSFEVPTHVDSFHFSGHQCPELIESPRISVEPPHSSTPPFGIPLILSFLILSGLVTPLIHLITLISATYCDFFTAHVHSFLPGFSLLHTYPALSLHNYLTVPSPYCASILLEYALYRTPFLDLYTFMFSPVSPYVAAPGVLHPPSLYLA